jgi:hypothetical protein
MNERERRGAVDGRPRGSADVSLLSHLGMFVNVPYEEWATGILPVLTEFYAESSQLPHMPLAGGNQILLTIGS